jgi:hypothetical protein
MAAVSKHAVGLGREQEVGQGVLWCASRDRRKQGALGPVAVAYSTPVAQPPLERRDLGRRRDRGAVAPRRLVLAVARDAAQPMKQSEVGVLGRKERQKVAECGEDREADAPAVAVARTEQRRLAQDLGWRDARGEQAVGRLGDHEAQVVGKPVVEPAAPVGDRVGVAGPVLDPYFAVMQLDREGRHVVGPQIEVQPLARSNRAWCQWQVRMPSSIEPRCNGKPKCGQRLSMANTRPSSWTTRIGQRRPRTTIRPFACNSSTVPARTRSSCPSRITRLPALDWPYPKDGRRGSAAKTRGDPSALCHCSARASNTSRATGRAEKTLGQPA